jgi:hypothetical protein
LRRRRRGSQWRTQPLRLRRDSRRQFLLNGFPRRLGFLYSFGSLRLFDMRGRGTWRLFRRRGGAVGRGLFGPLRSSGAAAEKVAQFLRYIIIDRTRVSLLFSNAQLRKFVQQFVSFDFQLPGQHVNTNLVHK